MKGARSLPAVCIALAIAIAGCFGPWNTPPTGESYYVTFEGGSGYRDILSYANTTGSFPIRALVDPEWRILYVGWDDGAIRTWNFSSEDAITNTVWAPSAETCVWGGFLLLPDHTIVTACGARVSAFANDGRLRWSVEFSSEITGIVYAQDLGSIIAGVKSPPSMEARFLGNGTLRWTMPLPDTIWQVSTNAAGTVIAGNLHSTAGPVTFFDLQNGSNRTLSPGGAFVSLAGSLSWAILNGGWDDDHQTPYDTLRAYDWALEPTQRASFILENASSASPLSFTQDDLYGTPDGSEVSYFSVRGTYSYSNTGAHPGSDVRNFIYAYNLTGGLVRGMTVPGQEIYVKMLENGSMFAVSGVRAALGGSQLWLSYGAPECTPPVLVRHNTTA